MPRKPFAVEVLKRPDDHSTGEVLVVCDDGTVWTYTVLSTGWQQHPSIPGTVGDKKPKEPSKPPRMRRSN